MARLAGGYAILMLLLLPCGGSDASAADWPQFRFDAQRSAATPEKLPADLHLLWERRLPPPLPAFPSEHRLSFDASYEPVVLGKTMFVPSMVTDSIAALDTGTGKEKWRFFTDGPVRFAPVASDGKVYVGSDDGYLYCLGAADGRLLWKFRGLPKERTDRKLLGNGRLISLWPSRGGPVLSGGMVYFAAGLWPDDGVFLHALEAETGRVVWSNINSDQIPRANMDHGVAQYAGLTPQGYLAVINNRLVVPCGAQLPAFLDLKDGKLGAYTMGWGGRDGLPKGSWFVAGAGKFLSQSGDLYDITRTNDEKFRDPRGRYDFKHMLYPGGFTRLVIDPSNHRALGRFREPVITPQAMFYNDNENGIVSYDLTKFETVERAKVKPTKDRKNDRYPDKWKAMLRRLWSMPSELKVHIKAGPRLYVGGPGTVQAIDIPGKDDKPKISWQAKIEGTPHRMLAADGKLFIVTLEGRIFAFGTKSEAESEAIVHLAPDTLSKTRDEWTRRAGEILEATKASGGYALVLGLDEGRLVEELLSQSPMYVIAVDSSEAKVRALREKLHAAGLYGTRSAVHVGDPLTYAFPPYIANLIVSEDGTLAKNAVSDASTIYHPLRPYGGVACLSVPAKQQQKIVAGLSAAKLAKRVVRASGDYVLLVRQGALPDSANWSHDGANAANAGASQDRFLRAPLALLWFDGSIRWHRKIGSAVVRISGGRAIVRAGGLHAIDVYTGRHLWDAKLPAGGGSINEIVAVDDGVYVAGGKKCLVLDPASGKNVREIVTPEGTTGNWANIRVWEEFFIGTIGNDVVCLNRATGKPVWKFACARPGLSLAVGGGRVFCSELLNTRRGETAEKAGTKTHALDVKTGDVLWQVVDGSAIRYSDELDLVVTNRGVYRGKTGKRLRAGVASSQIVGDQLVSGTADRFSVFDLASGAKKGDELQWYRRGCTGLRSSCNLVTIRFKGNAAYVDLESREITSLWNIRSGCNNNLFPANGILNVPNVTGGCECNYTPTSKAFAPVSVITR